MKDTIIVITSFPTKRKQLHARSNFNAIGWHAEKVIRRLSKDNKLVVLAEKASKKTSTTLFNKNTTIVRSWTKGNPFSIFSLWKLIAQIKSAQRVYIPFEFNIFGGTIPNIALVGLLFILKLLGKQVTFEFHQVIFDIGELKKHIHIRNSFQKHAFNAGLNMFYRLVGLLSESVIVFESELKERLATFVDDEKITVLSLSTSRSTGLTKKAARLKIGTRQKEFIVLVFGFINGYKGIPWIMQKLDTSVRILIAGGKNPYLKHLPHYKKFYASVVDMASHLSHVTHTGFVPDAKVEAYYKAADVVVIPYEVFMSASGPFSLALSYKKPVLLANTLINYKKSEDFAQAMHESGLKDKDIFFSHKNDALPRLLKRYRTSAQYRSKLLKFVTLLAEERSEERVITTLQSLLLFTEGDKKATINVLPRIRLQKSW